MVWKNVRKNVRGRDKQVEIQHWMEENKCDVCAINETGLNGSEYMEVRHGDS